MAEYIRNLRLTRTADGDLVNVLEEIEIALLCYLQGETGLYEASLRQAARAVNANEQTIAAWRAKIVRAAAIRLEKERIAG